MICLPVFNIIRLRMTTDGQGVTSLVGVQGCPLGCRMCLNPHARKSDAPVRLHTVESLIDALKIDGLYFAATGGGATFGGGEPLMHAEFLAAFGRKKPGLWRMNVETSLNVPEENVRALLPHVDEWIVDVKDLNPEIYRAYTGRDNRQVLGNLPLLKEAKGSVLLRVPFIAGFNAREDCGRTEAALREMGFENIDRFDYRIL